MNETMLAAVFHAPHDLRVEEVPMPEIGPREILLKVLAANICGTDLRIYHGGHRKYPAGATRIPGHEVAGEIAAVGADVTAYKLGARYFIAPNMGRGDSRATISGNNNLDPEYQAFGITMDGAFAEYMRLPAEAIQQGNLIPIAAEADPAVAALVEPLACVLRGQNALHVQDGDVVLIMGAGPIGVMHALLARLRGAARVIVSEPSSERRARVLEFGADRVVDPLNEDLLEIVLAESHGRGADAIIVAAPSKPAQESTLALAAMGGRINFFGGLPKQDPLIQFDANAVHYKELVVTGTTACSTYDCVRAADLMASGRLNLAPLITHRFPLGDAVAAFAAAAGGQELRVALEP